MAHYAFLDQNNIVTEVIVGRNEDEVIEGVSNWEEFYSQERGQVCKRTSYNGNIRKNFAGIGYSYSEDLDAFIAPKPFDSWILNTDNCRWECSIDYPKDGNFYIWNEENIEWQKPNTDMASTPETAITFE
jgi:hypothetical protein